MKWQPKDVIAIIVLIGAGLLIYQGINSWVGISAIAVICAYYGIDLAPFISVGRNQKNKKGE